jgi:hypothetical protein
VLVGLALDRPGWRTAAPDGVSAITARRACGHRSRWHGDLLANQFSNHDHLHPNKGTLAAGTVSAQREELSRSFGEVPLQAKPS